MCGCGCGCGSDDNEKETAQEVAMVPCKYCRTLFAQSAWSNGTPNTVSVTVQRAGWITFEGNETSSVVNPSSNEIIRQIQLQRIGEDFGFGTYPTGKVY